MPTNQTPTPKHGMSATLITLIISVLTAIIVYLTSCGSTMSLTSPDGSLIITTPPVTDQSSK